MLSLSPEVDPVSLLLPSSEDGPLLDVGFKYGVDSGSELLTVPAVFSEPADDSAPGVFAGPPINSVPDALVLSMSVVDPALDVISARVVASSPVDPTLASVG